MQCFENKESKNIKERRKIYAARDFSDKYDHALFKYQIKFVKFFIISLKRLGYVTQFGHYASWTLIDF
jgi:hypothetical protein